MPTPFSVPCKQTMLCNYESWYGYDCARYIGRDSGISGPRLSNTSTRRYKIIDIPCDFLHTNACWLVSLRSWSHIVAVLKLKNCDILKGSLAQALQFWSLVTTIPVWCWDIWGSPMKASNVYYVKSMGTKVMTQHFCPCTWRFHPLRSHITSTACVFWHGCWMGGAIIFAMDTSSFQTTIS